MRLIINDANILIDIVKLDIVDAFMTLGFNLYTTDFVFAELNEAQQVRLARPQLSIIKTESTEDIYSIIRLVNSNNGLSFEDCSVWHYTQKMNGTLITGDRLLRRRASLAGLEVKGIIFILEQIKVQNLLSVVQCIEKLEALKVLNDRLPIIEIDNRIQEWKNE